MGWPNTQPAFGSRARKFTSIVTTVVSGLHQFSVFGVGVELTSADGVFMPSLAAAENNARRAPYSYVYKLRLPPSDF